MVTPNKELMAKHGGDLLALAAEQGADLMFEGAVGGGIPLIKPLKESLAGDSIERIVGIVNGTTNYILTGMARENRDFGEALAAAQQLGYAEADPTADVEGFDSLYKIAILASIAFGSRVPVGEVYHGHHRRGRRRHRYARSLGSASSCWRSPPSITVRSISACIPPSFLSSIRSPTSMASTTPSWCAAGRCKT